MKKNQTFYWIKLKKEFMNGEVIDFLMSQKNGANYVVLYQLLIMETINTNGKLCNEIGEVIIPFNIEKIQRDCKWFDIDTVRVAMELYSRLGLIYKNNEGILVIANFKEIVGSETYWAKQKRLQRAKDEIGQCPMNVQNTLISNISNLNSISISNNKNNKKQQKNKYGEYNHILLSDDELTKLNSDYGEKETKEAIKYLDEYIEMKGTKYNNHNLVLRKWVFDTIKKEANHKKRKYTDEELNSLFDDINKVKLWGD